MSYLHYLCLFRYSGVQHILCCVFVVVFFVLLPVSLDCPCLIVPSVFSNVYIANDIALSINTYAFWNLNKTKFYFKFSVLHF